MNNKKLLKKNFVSGLDLINVGKSFSFDRNYVFKEEEIESIEQLFPNKNWFAYILINSETNEKKIGHWIVLRCDSDVEFTYFDCLGDKMTERLENLFKTYALKVPTLHINLLSERLMSETATICGKYCLSFTLAGDISLQDYIDIIKDKKPFTADQKIDKLIKIEYEESENPFI